MQTRLYSTSAPALNRCVARCKVSVSVTWTTSALRPVGDDVDVPKFATPEIDTAGPIGSLTGAASRLCMYCTRASLIVLDDIVVK